MPRLSHETPGLTYACPACDATTIYERKNARKQSDRPFRCEECNVCFLYAIERPLKKGAGTVKQQTLPGFTRSLKINSHDLEAMSPEDLGLNPVGVRSGQP